MGAATAIFELLRWQNCLITALVVWAATLLLPHFPPVGNVALAALAAACIAGFGNAHNDLVDQAADRINHPERPLPSGRLSAGSARLITLIALVTGLVAAQLVQTNCFILAVLAAALLWAYNVWLKRIPFLGNVLIAAICASTFLFAAVMDRSYPLWQFDFITAGALTAFWYHLGREIIKDLQDAPGDSAGGVRTLATLFPTQVAKLAATMAFLGLFGALYLTHLYLKPRPAFAVTVILGTVLPVAGLTVLMWLKGSYRTYRFISTLLKMLMPIGLLALLVGRG